MNHWLWIFSLFHYNPLKINVYTSATSSTVFDFKYGSQTTREQRSFHLETMMSIISHGMKMFFFFTIIKYKWRILLKLWSESQSKKKQHHVYYRPSVHLQTAYPAHMVAGGAGVYPSQRRATLFYCDKPFLYLNVTI